MSKKDIEVILDRFQLEVEDFKQCLPLKIYHQKSLIFTFCHKEPKPT